MVAQTGAGVDAHTTAGLETGATRPAFHIYVVALLTGVAHKGEAV
jgi:hypothetical protein